MTLDQTDIDNNKKHYDQDYSEFTNHRACILRFCEQHGITLNNLTTQEKSALRTLLNDISINDKQLLEWKNTITIAIAGQAVKAYSAISKELNDKNWGSDLHLNAILQQYITSEFHINQAGNYVIPPRPLLEIEISSTLTRVATNLNKANANGPTTLYIPVSTGNHWRTLEVRFNAAILEQATLIDPMSTISGTIDRQTQGIIQAINPRAIFKSQATSTQQDSFRCMDYVAQHILSKFAQQHPITQATSGRALRTACLQEIAKTKPQLVTPTHTDRINYKQVDGLLGELTEPMKIKTFDEVFAYKLQKLYTKNPNATKEDEEKLVKQAQHSACTNLGTSFFQPNTQAPDDTTPHPTR